MIAASRAQIGEFSFILGALGVSLGAAAAGRARPRPRRRADFDPARRRSCSPPPTGSTRITSRAEEGRRPRPRQPAPAAPETPTREPVPVTQLTDHVVLVGYGRVGSVVGAELKAANVPLLVFESDEDIVETLHRQGIEAIAGNAADPELARAGELPGGALPAGRDPGRLRGRTDRRAGARHQSEAPDHRALAFRGGDRAPEAPRRHQGDHGRAADRQAMIEDARAATRSPRRALPWPRSPPRRCQSGGGTRRDRPKHFFSSTRSTTQPGTSYVRRFPTGPIAPRSRRAACDFTSSAAGYHAAP